MEETTQEEQAERAIAEEMARVELRREAIWTRAAAEEAERQAVEYETLHLPFMAAKARHTAAGYAQDLRRLMQLLQSEPPEIRAIIEGRQD